RAPAKRGRATLAAPSLAVTLLAGVGLAVTLGVAVRLLAVLAVARTGRVRRDLSTVRLGRRLRDRLSGAHGLDRGPQVLLVRRELRGRAVLVEPTRVLQHALAVDHEAMRSRLGAEHARDVAGVIDQEPMVHAAGRGLLAQARIRLLGVVLARE